MRTLVLVLGLGLLACDGVVEKKTPAQVADSTKVAVTDSIAKATAKATADSLRVHDQTRTPDR